MADATNAEILASIRALHAKLDGHIDDERDTLLGVVAQVQILRTAFPGEDAAGHRAFHEARIKDALNNEAFLQQLRKDIGKYGVLALIGFIGASIWYYVTHFIFVR